MLAWMLALTLTAHAEDGWTCEATGSWEHCAAPGSCSVTAETANSQNPDRATAEKAALDICAGQVQQAVLFGNMGKKPGDFLEYGYKDACVVSSCTEGDIAGWNGASTLQVEKGKGVTRTEPEPTEDSSAQPVAADPQGRKPAGEVPECAELVNYFCSMCGGSSGVCTGVKAEPKSPGECKSDWMQISGLVSLVPKDALKGQVCSMVP